MSPPVPTCEVLRFPVERCRAPAKAIEDPAGSEPAEVVELAAYRGDEREDPLPDIAA